MRRSPLTFVNQTVFRKPVASRIYCRGLTYRTMASLSINSKQKLNSGYEIPLLGFGVRCHLLQPNNVKA